MKSSEKKVLGRLKLNQLSKNVLVIHLKIYSFLRNMYICLERMSCQILFL